MYISWIDEKTSEIKDRILDFGFFFLRVSLRPDGTWEGAPKFCPSSVAKFNDNQVQFKTLSVDHENGELQSICKWKIS